MDGRPFAGTHYIQADIEHHMKLEVLTLSNISEALDFAELSHADSAWKDYPFKRDILFKNIERMMGRDQYFTCLCRKDGKLIGYWFATLCVLLCSDKPRGEENGIYVIPEYRGGRAGYMMWLAYKQWCFKHDAEPIAYVHFGDDRDNQKAYSFFKKLGMIECGRIFRGGQNGLRTNS